MPPAGFIVLGLVQGCLAGLNSLGFVLLWRTTRLVNLAQPTLGLIGGVLTGVLVTASGWSFWWAAPVGILVGALLGLASDRVVFRKLKDAPRAVMLVATVGLAGVFAGIQTALPFIFTGRSLNNYQVNIGATLDVFPIRLSGAHLLALGVFPLAVVGLMLFLHRTRLGLAALALGQDTERAQCLGVSASVVRSVVWVIAGTLATIAGILSIPILGFNLEGRQAPIVLLLALAPAVFAGFRNIGGTAAAALALGVAYQGIRFHNSRAGVAELVFAAALLIAVALQRVRLGRVEAAARTSSWEAAATVRPLAWAVRRLKRFRIAATIFGVAAFIAAILPPMFLAADHKLLYATSAAVALAVLAVSCAWMFTGEIALGHWGLAAFGAAISGLLPGPWPLRAMVAGLAMAVAGGLLALASRRSSNLSFAVLGLAAAGAGPVSLLYLSTRSTAADPGQVGMFAAGFTVLAVIVVIRLRSSVQGSRMVAARDDPQRAAWLGADPVRARIVGLAISSGLAGVAGALVLAATPGSLAPGVFDPQRSLDLLMMAVIGGLGSPIGAILGAGLFQSAYHILPNAWKLLVGGTGVLIVVMFRPAGLSGLPTWLRDQAVRLLTTKRDREPQREPEKEVA